MASVSVQNLSIAIGKNTILQNININFREGKRTAIIGPNGCGKSTLLRAVAGLNRNYSGKVLLNGADMKNMPRRKIAELLAILPQGVTAPADLTVRELVACGRFPYRSLFKREGKNDAEIIETAMQKTHIAHLAGRFVATLSGGERQRIAIARAMLKNAPVVILDEATAYIDPENEALVQKAISALTVGKTLIVIAHRLSTIVGADNIVVVKDGTIHAQGTHENLLETCPLYRDMWQAHIGAKDQM